MRTGRRTLLAVGIAFAVLACAGATGTGIGTEVRVRFASLEPIPGASAIPPGEVEGWLLRPGGEGPFPVVVVLHGCAGPYETHVEWAREMAGWGYATLRVDSFGPRGIEEICTDIRRYVPREADVNGAVAYLKTRDFIDGSRIAVVGFSHGAGTALNVSRVPGSLREAYLPALRAAVLFYPWCPARADRFAPAMLILIGDADDWTPAERCRLSAAGSTSEGGALDLVVYPGATHSFDCRACNGVYWGHTLRFDPAARADAAARIRVFLERHL